MNTTLSEAHFFKIAVTVDNVIFGFDGDTLQVLLIKRGSEPFSGAWALPGDFVDHVEDLDDAAHRILKDLTGVEGVFLDQVKTFGSVNRHPYGRVVTTAYISLVRAKSCKINRSGWATDIKWHNAFGPVNLAFDHALIIKKCLENLKIRVKTQPIGFELLPPKFTLTELQSLYEVLLGIELDKRNFRKKILSENVLERLSERQRGVAHRPARLYQFNKERYKQLANSGFQFV